MAWAVKSRQLINIGLDMRVAWAAKSRQFSNTGVTITTKMILKTMYLVLLIEVIKLLR